MMWLDGGGVGIASKDPDESELVWRCLGRLSGGVCV